MKKLIIALTSVFCFAASANTQLNVYCEPTDVLVKTLVEKYSEGLMFVMNSDISHIEYGLFMNQDTHTWTYIVADNRKKISCVLGSGRGLKFPGSRPNA